MTDPAADPDDTIRVAWGRNISEQMELVGMTNKALAAELRRRGIEVSAQAIGQWRAGQNAPRPHLMIAVASCLRVPARVLFSLDFVEVAVAGAA